MRFKKFVVQVCTDLINFLINQCKKLLRPITNEQLVRAVHANGNLERWLVLGANADAKDYNGFTIFFNLVQDVVTTLAAVSDFDWINRKCLNIDALIRYRANLHLHDAGLSLLHGMPDLIQHMCQYRIYDDQLDAFFLMFSRWQLAIIKAGVNLDSMQNNATALFKTIAVTCNTQQHNLLRGLDQSALQLIDHRANVNLRCDEIMVSNDGEIHTLSATALHLASKRQVISMDLINALLHAGADPNARDDFRFTPLLYICFMEEENPRLSTTELFNVLSLFLARGGRMHNKTPHSADVLTHGGLRYFENMRSAPSNKSLAPISARVLSFLWGDCELSREVANNVYKALASSVQRQEMERPRPPQ